MHEEYFNIPLSRLQLCISPDATMHVCIRGVFRGLLGTEAGRGQQVPVTWHRQSSQTPPRIST